MKNQIMLVSAFTLIFGASLSQAAENKPAMPTPKADVYIVPQPQSVSVTLKYPAEVKANKKIKVVARVSGVLEKKYFTEGAAVKQNELLYKIEDNIYKAKYDAALASVKMSEAALDNASRNWDRVKKLYEQKAISEEKKDSSLFVYEQSLAALSLAKAQSRQAKIDYDYTQVRAPIGGVTGLKQIDIGDFVGSNPPTTLVEITQNDKVYVEFSMPQRDYQNIKNKLWLMPANNSAVNIEIDGKPSKIQGTVDFVNVNTDKQTSVVKMRAVVDNKDGYLMAGGFVRVVLEGVVQKNAITVLQKAVVQNPMGTVVFIENKGVVDVRPVMLGSEAGDKYIVAGGPLKSGDKVFINNFFRLKPGEKVIVDKTITK